jgi:AcrR family transcriptional regulator
MADRQERAEATRARLLSAAERCFARSGYDATSVAEVCAQAEVSKGAFYHHFDSKQAVFLELLTAWLDRLEGQLDELRIGQGDVPSGLISMSPLLQDVLRSSAHQFPIYLEFWSRAIRDEQIRRAAIEPFRRYRRFFARMLEAGMAEGSLRMVDPKIGASVLIGLAIGVLVQGVFDPSGGDWGAVAAEGIRTMVRGMEVN